MKKYFAGIGSRTIPTHIKVGMGNLAEILTTEGYTLRSGNATGSDQAFASGVIENKAQIWLPWNDFELEFQESHPDHEYRRVGTCCCPGSDDPEAWESVEKFHPYYKEMQKLQNTPYSKKYYDFMKFMSRNYRQIRGFGEPDSEFVICWTHDGTAVGGTGQAIRIANHYNIPVFNMYNLSDYEVLKEIDKLNMIN